MALAAGPRENTCSARECIAPAEWAVIWSNPRIHTGREKTWLACEEHRQFLHDYLAYRNFPVRDVPLAEFLVASGSADASSA